MLEKIKEAAASKLVTMLGVWIAAGGLVSSSVVLTIGTAAIEDNTEALTQYETSTAGLRVDIKAISAGFEELRVARFEDNLRLLSKQAYKIINTPDDIKPDDMLAAANFCDSTLYYDYEETLGGGRKVWADSACESANAWLRAAPH